MSAARLDVVRLARRRRRARAAGGGEGIVFVDQSDCLLRDAEPDLALDLVGEASL